MCVAVIPRNVFHGSYKEVVATRAAPRARSGGWGGEAVGWSASQTKRVYLATLRPVPYREAELSFQPCSTA